MESNRRDFLKSQALAASAAAAGIPIVVEAAPNAAPANAADNKVRWDKAPCRFCGTGCAVMVGVQNGRVVATQGDPESPVNRGLNCIKGYFLSKIMYGKDRLTTPLLRKKNGKYDKEGEFTPVSWDEAFDIMAAKWKDTLKTDGPTGIGMFGGLAVLPLYLQIVGGADPTKAGLQLLPLTMGIMSGSVFSGQTISRIGRYKMFPLAGSILMTLTLAWMTQITAVTSYGIIAIMSFFFGFGLGNLMQPTVLAVQNAVSPRDIGVATSSVTLFRQLGATLGTALFLSLLFGRLGDLVGARFETAFETDAYQAALMDPANAETAQKLQSLQTAGGDAFNDTSWLASANQILVRPILDGFTDATTLVCGVGAAITAFSIIFAIMVPNNELRGPHDSAPSAGH